MNHGCDGKVGYLSWDATNRALSRLRFKYDPREGQVQPYRCRQCGFWHFGRSAFVTKKKKR